MPGAAIGVGPLAASLSSSRILWPSFCRFIMGYEMLRRAYDVHRFGKNCKLKALHKLGDTMGNRAPLYIVAAVIAVVGFLSIERYVPSAGFIWNVIHAEINLTEPCPHPDKPDFSRFSVQGRSLLRGDCGYKLPYSQLLGAMVAFAAIVALWPTLEKKSGPTQDSTRSTQQLTVPSRTLPLVLSLAAVSVACAILLSLSGAGGFRFHNGRALGEALGAAIAIFTPSAIAAAIASWANKGKSLDRFSFPFLVGSTAAVAVTLLAYVGSK